MSNKILAQMKKIQLVLVLLLGFLFESRGQQPNSDPEVNYNVVHLRDTIDPSTDAFKHLGGDEVQLLDGYGSSPSSTQFSHIKIDPNTVAPVPPNIGAPFTESDFDAHSIDFSLPVGHTPGAYGVSGSGAATYSIPIQLPPGTNNMVPSLSISYNSQSGNGVLGKGWTIGGLSSITRVPQTLYHDGIVDGVSMTEEDRYALDGNRLILTSGSQGTSGSEYGTELETFSKITSYGSLNGMGPKWFVVLTKDGETIEFGNSDLDGGNDAWLLSEDGGAIAYFVNKISDQHGNYVEYDYVHDNHQSRISQILYTGNSNMGLEPYNVIQFHYQDRSDKNEVFVAGSSIKVDVLLRKISVTADGSYYKSYEFDYGEDLYSFLKSVTEYGANGEQLNPTIFKYGDVSRDFEISETNLSSEDNQWLYTGDFNGDGLTDLVEVEREHQNLTTGRMRFHTKIKLKRGNGEGLFTQVDLVDRTELLTYELTVAGGTTTHETKVHSTLAVMDFTGDGRSDILIVDKYAQNSSPLFIGADRIRIFSFDGNGLVESNFAPPEPISLSTDIQTGDFDGDGVGDILLDLGPNNDTYVVYPRHGNNFYPVDLPDLSGSTRHLVVDHNGDGRSDVLYITPEGHASSVWTIDASGGSPTGELLYESNDFPVREDRIFPGDFNGDGKTDLLNFKSSTNSWTINLSTGVDFRSYGIPLSPGVDFSSDRQEFTVGDFNGDGKTDFLHLVDDPNTNTNDRRAIIYYARAFGFENASTSGGGITISPFWYDEVSFSREVSSLFDSQKVNEDPYFDSDDFHFNLIPTLIAGDFNGDGMTGLLVKPDDPTLGHSLFRFGVDNKGFLLEQVMDGLGAIVRFDFGFPPQSNYADVWYWYDQSDYPINAMVAPLPLVRKVTVPDGIGGYGDLHYKYGNGLLHKEGKGFLGFKSVMVRNELSNRRSTTWLELDDVFPVLKKTSMTVQTAGGQNVVDETVVQEIVDRGNLRFWIRTNSSTKVDYLSGANISNNFAYSPNGNLEFSATVTGTQSTVVHRTYTDCGTWFIPNRVNHEETIITRDGESYSRSVDHLYNADGSLESTTTDQGVTTEFSYDGFGNVTESTLSASGVPTRSTQLEFEPKGRFISKKTNSLGQETTFSYDNRWGKTLTKTGLTGLSSTFQYDGFGQLTEATDPLGITTITNRGWDNSSVPNSIFYVESTSQGSPSIKVWHDLFGREIQNETTGFAQQTLTSKTTYDTRGRIDNEVSPNATGGTMTTTYGYDTYDRLRLATGPASTIEHEYQVSGGQLKKTSTDLTTQQWSSKTTDAVGLVTKSEDDGGILNYAYHPSGQLKSVAMVGQTVPPALITYNSWGYQETLVDANAGESSYEYDNYGELTSQTINGYEFVSTYDALGRVVTKTGPKLRYDQNGSVEVDATNQPVTEIGTTSYDYHTEGGGLNQLKKITSDNGTSIEYDYDDYGRATSEKETVQSRSFETGYTYDSFGRVSSMTYPGGLTISYSYDGNGFLTSISSGSEDIFTAEEANSFGQLTRYTLGNGKTTTKTYTDLGLPIDAITAGVQELFTEFDAATGNLSFREDFLNGVNGGLKEDFEYDDLNRLTNTHFDWSSGTPAVPDVTVVYDPDNGNISSKSDGGDYDYWSHKPNAVKSITNGDENISQKLQKIVYTPDGRRVGSIVESSDTREGHYEGVFLYGPDGNRKRMVMRQKDENEAYQTLYTKHYSGAYEEMAFEGGNTYQLSYISGPEGVCAIHVNNVTTGEQGFYYPYTDHLGSILTLTDDQGNIVGKQSFDAWGRYRDPDTWELLDSDPSAGGVFANASITMPEWLTRGFTGHEHLAYFDLINMNGRFYDPIPGRMLSADNYVQSGGYSQGYNRYTYAFNNPLRYTDPDGELVWLAPVAGALIGGAINVATNWNNIDNFGEGLAAFGAGAVNGALTATFGMAGAIGGGALVGMTNSIIGQTGNGNSIGDINMGQVFMGGMVGGVSGMAGFAAGQYASSAASAIAVNGLHLGTQSALTGLIAGAAGGAAGGFAGGFAGGLLTTGDPGAAFKAGLQGMAMGAGIGAAAGAVGGYMAAKESGLNPWNGRPKESVVIGEGMTTDPSRGWFGVDKIADDLKSDFYKPDSRIPKDYGETTPELMYDNGVWIEMQMQRNVVIYDRGPVGNNSLYYNMEMGRTTNYNNLYNVKAIYSETHTIRILIIQKQ